MEWLTIGMMFLVLMGFVLISTIIYSIYSLILVFTPSYAIDVLSDISASIENGDRPISDFLKQFPFYAWRRITKRYGVTIGFVMAFFPIIVTEISFMLSIVLRWLFTRRIL